MSNEKVFVLFSLVKGLSVKAQITVRGVVSMRNEGRNY